MANEVTTTNGMHLLAFMAQRYALEEEQFARTVRATCGLDKATPEQFAAFLIVCKEYELNPILREIYAFPSRAGGVVPIVSIDGWVNLVNSHPQCDGFEFEDHHDAGGKLESITCRMHRKDRKFPVTITEYLAECRRATDPWKMEHRMLRHKALIQAARYAFGFAGIYDEDEGRVIADSGPAQEPRRPPSATPPPAIEHKPEPQEGSAQAGSAPQEPAKEAAGGAAQTPEQIALPYLEAIAKQTTAETLAAWQKAHKAEFDAMPDEPYALVVNAYKKRKATLTKQAKASISSGPEADKADATKAMPKAAKIPNVEDPAEYEDFISYCNKLMDECTDLDVLQSFFNGMVEDNRKHIMPPDFDGLQEIYGRNEQRLKRAGTEG